MPKTDKNGKNLLHRRSPADLHTADARGKGSARRRGRAHTQVRPYVENGTFCGFYMTFRPFTRAKRNVFGFFKTFRSAVGADLRVRPRSGRYTAAGRAHTQVRPCGGRLTFWQPRSDRRAAAPAKRFCGFRPRLLIDPVEYGTINKRRFYGEIGGADRRLCLTK